MNTRVSDISKSMEPSGFEAQWAELTKGEDVFDVADKTIAEMFYHKGFVDGCRAFKKAIREGRANG